MTYTPYDEEERAKELATYTQDKTEKEKEEYEAWLAKQRRDDINERGSHAVLEASEYGTKENLTELKNAVVGGVRDTVSSGLTAPERFHDMASGEMHDAMQNGGYEPNWNPLGGSLNPTTKTWWGKLIRGGVHFGTMAIPIVGWAGAAGRVSKVATFATKASTMVPRFIPAWATKGAGVGLAADFFSEYSQDANGLQVLRDRFGFTDTPCTTNDDDHPITLTAKNMCEGLGIGAVSGGLGTAISKARNLKGINTNTSKEVLNKVDTIEANRAAKASEAAKIQVDTNLRNATTKKLFAKGIDFNQLTPDEQINAMTKVQRADRSGKYSTWTPPGEDNIARAARKNAQRDTSVNNQILEKAEVEGQDFEIRGHKNKPIVNSWQGNPIPTDSPYNVGQTLKRIYREWGSELGSTESLVTPAATEQLAENGLGKKGITPQIAKELLGDARFKSIMEDLNAKGRSLQEAYGDAYERFQEVVGGRDAGALEPDEFWGPISRSVSTQGDFEMWSVDNILAADLVQESLFKQLRDRAMVAREILDITDLSDVDGPLKYIRDNLIVGMEQVKRSKFLTSPEYQDLINVKGGKQQIEDILTDLHIETKNQVDMMLDVSRNSPSDEFLHAMVEAFSMSNKIQNWQDFDGFMRQRLFGRTTEQGVKETGALVRELQGVMVNSVLSGPKTPLRAIMGTSTATFTRPMARTIGSAMQYAGGGFKDPTTLRESLAEMNGMIHAVPEAYEYFMSRLNSYWAGDISTIRNRFSEYSNSDQHWELMEYWSEQSGRATDGEIGAFRIANLARNANVSNFLNYNTKLMAATDDAHTLILARSRSRVKALREAMDAQRQGIIPDISPELINNYQNRFYNEIFDPVSGTVRDTWLKHAREEVTLTKDLTGFAKALNTLFNQQPLIKPFYFFARTGINGLELTAKHTPGFNFLVQEFNDIAFANPENLSTVAKYGIENVQDLANARALQNGRLALGSSIIFMAGQKYLNGELTGDGPSDYRTRQNWLNSGWVPRSIKLGDVWVSHESLEPFTSLLSAVSNLGDNRRLMGGEWVEKGLLSHALIISKGMVSKTYLQGLTSLTDLFGRNPKQLEKIAANLANNMIPLAGLRNEIGKVINPHMKELNSGFWESIRNRNQALEVFAEEELPVKYDLLNGRPIRDWDPLTRFYNAIVPIQLNFDSDSPGRKLLHRSNYDLSMSVMTAPDGTDLSDNPAIRSDFQRAIGEQDIESKLAKLAERQDVIESIENMEADIASGRTNRPPGITPMSYPHNILINNIINDARRQAWATMLSHPDVLELKAARELEEAALYNRKQGDTQKSNTQYDQATQLLEMTNK